MATIIWIIVADVIAFLLFAYQYRQELGLTVNGEHDLPVVRKKPAGKPAPPASAPESAANRGQRVPASS